MHLNLYNCISFVGKEIAIKAMYLCVTQTDRNEIKVEYPMRK